MKKGFKYLLFVAALVAAASCDRKRDWDLPDGYAYATVMKAEVEPVREDINNDIYFSMDSGVSFDISENKYNTNLKFLDAGDRVVVGVTLEDAINDAYDHSAKLYDVVKVIMGENREVLDEEQNEALADHKLSYMSANTTLTYGYLNLFVGFMSEKMSDAKFYLVDNALTDGSADEGDYLSLELRFDRGNCDCVGPIYEKYLSFDMNDYRERLEDKKGVRLRIKTLKSGVVEVMIDSENLFPGK